MDIRHSIVSKIAHYWGELKKNEVCGKSFKGVVKGSEVKWSENHLEV